MRSRWRLAAGVGALIALVGAVLVGSGPASAAKNAADVVFIIDESSSMGDEIADVKAQIDAVVSTLTSQFDDRYGLVAFGGAPPGQPVQDPFTRTNMTDSASFKTALSSSNSYAVPGGSQERGLAATTYAMQSITGFRAGAGVCAILISDEAPSFQVDQATDLAQATAALAARGAAFFAITDTSLSGITGTYGPDPGSLAAASGGAVFSLTDFRADAVPVLQAISQRCVKTVQERGGSASFGAIPTTGLAPLPVTFTATAGEPDATYAWDFGDGSTGNGQVVSHTFTTVGSFTVKLTVTAPGFEPASASQRIVTRTEADGELGSLPTDCTIVGTGAAETLVGTAGPDVICGLGGNDRLRGAGGKDVIVGGTGDDVLKGGPGDDRLVGNAGADVLRGQAGNDTLRGLNGRDLLLGGVGNDALDGGKGKDRLAGGSGLDAMLGGPGPDRLLARDGAKDTVNGGPGIDQARTDPVDVVTSVP